MNAPLDIDIIAHALEAAPQEAIGAVVLGEYVRLDNTSPEPERYCELTSASRNWCAVNAEAIVHSHCYKSGEFVNVIDAVERGPSETDMRQQIAMAVPWGLVTCTQMADVAGGAERDAWVADGPRWWGKGAPVLPYENRTWVHGITDCYTLCADWLARERGVKLPQVPRGWGWWNERSLYEEWLGKAGATSIDLKDARPGDGLLAMTRRNRFTDHAAILVDENTVLHHMHKRKSKAEALTQFQRYVTITHAVRFEGANA